jgi:hypothetical protein
MLLQNKSSNETMHEFYVTCMYITLGEMGHEYRGQRNAKKVRYSGMFLGLA